MLFFVLIVVCPPYTLACPIQATVISWSFKMPAWIWLLLAPGNRASAYVALWVSGSKTLICNVQKFIYISMYGMVTVSLYLFGWLNWESPQQSSFSISLCPLHLPFSHHPLACSLSWNPGTSFFVLLIERSLEPPFSAYISWYNLHPSPAHAQTISVSRYILHPYSAHTE